MVAAADLVAGRRIAVSRRAGDAVTIMGGTYNGTWSAVVDGRIVTGRALSDIPEFRDAITFRLLREA